MPNLSGANILIVGESPETVGLRTRLIESGATVHVVSIAGASLMVRQKQIDTAFIAANLDDRTHHLCGELTALRIAQIFVPPQRESAEPTSVTTVSLAGLRRKLRTA